MLTIFVTFGIALSSSVGFAMEPCRTINTYAARVADDIGLSTHDIEALLRHPRLADAARALIEAHAWGITHKKNAFYTELGEALADPRYSSTVESARSILHADLTRALLAKHGLEMPEAHQQLLIKVMARYPNVLPDPPFSLATVLPRGKAAVDGWPTETWQTIYKVMKNHYENDRASFPPRLLPQLRALELGGGLPSTNHIKPILRSKDANARLFKVVLYDYLHSHVMNYVGNHHSELSAGRANGGMRPVLDATWDEHVRDKKLSPLLAPLLRDYLSVVLAPPPPLVIRGEKISADYLDYCRQGLFELRREYLVELRAQEALAPAPAPEAPGLVPAAISLTPRQSAAPMVSRRRRNRATAEAQRAAEGASPNLEKPKPPKLSAMPELSAIEKEELFSRMSPSDEHYRSFLRAMDDGRRLLNAREYAKFEDKIAKAMQFIEAGGAPLQGQFAPTSKGDIFKLSPGGSSMTTRLWIGRIRGQYYIMMLAHDVKSGAQKENGLIQQIEREISALDAAWAREENSP